MECCKDCTKECIYRDKVVLPCDLEDFLEWQFGDDADFIDQQMALLPKEVNNPLEREQILPIPKAEGGERTLV